jgi:thioredoxin 1
MEYTFTDANFQKEVLEAEVPVLVDFWAPWCGPCRVQGPIIEELAGEIGASAKIGKLNVDENMDTSMKYGVMSIPTIIIFKKGEIAAKFVGVKEKDELAKAIGVASA